MQIVVVLILLLKPTWRKRVGPDMKILKRIRTSYQPTRYGVLRVVLAAASLLSMLLASGAGSHWN